MSEIPTDARQYRRLTTVEEAYVAAVRLKASEFMNVLNNLAISREVQLAKTNLEQAEMWAIKALTR